MNVTHNAPQRQATPHPGSGLLAELEPQKSDRTVRRFSGGAPLLVVPMLRGSDGVDGTTVSFLCGWQEREREREREKEKKRKREREKERKREIEKERKRERERDKVRERERRWRAERPCQGHGVSCTVRRCHGHWRRQIFSRPWPHGVCG